MEIYFAHSNKYQVIEQFNCKFLWINEIENVLFFHV